MLQRTPGTSYVSTYHRGPAPLNTALGVMAHDPSEILAIYLGADEAGGYLPMGQEERLSAAFPGDAKSALALIERYLDFPDYPPTEWTSNDLATEARIYEQKLARAFPELNARAINALACRWSYDWR